MKTGIDRALALRVSGWRGIALPPAIAAGIASFTWLTWTAGGVNNGLPYLMFIPVFLAAFGYGVVGGALSGLMAGAALGPWMPLEAQLGTVQSLDHWLLRAASFLGVGSVLGWARDSLLDAVALHGEAVRRSEEIETMKYTLLDSFSHEFRTPLTTAMGFASILRDRDDRLSPEKRHEFAERVVESTTRLAQLIDDLMDMTQWAHGASGVHPTTVVTVNLCDLLRGSLQGDMRRVRFHPGSERVRLDVQMAAMILDRLVSNALRFSEAMVDVHIQEEEPGWARIRVQDRGPGIPESQAETIFDPFQRGDPIVGHSPGLGIGLAVVARLAGLHGGRVSVSAREGGGSAFEVWLFAPQK